MINGFNWKNPVHQLAFGFGAGLSPVAPGTAGTLVGIPLFLLMADLSLPLYLGLTLVLFVAGIFICQRCSDDLGVHDHGGIVWDEIVGYLVTMVAMPAEPLWLLSGFLLFRLFDILKPWPVRRVDREVSGGLGIMLDDLLAGLLALLCQQLLFHYFA